MRILHVAPSFYPATYWGGPIWSTKAICDGIAANPQMEIEVLTTDAAGPDVSDRVQAPALPYRVSYMRRVAGHSVSPALLARLPRAIAAADVVHLTGTYSAPSLPVFLLCKVLGKPLVWSPRGALQASADWKDTPRRRAKHVFEYTLNLLRPRQIVMHVTAKSEAAKSVNRFAGVTTQIIPNAVDIPEMLLPKQSRQGRLRLMSMGRIHPKKGLDLLIEAMCRLPAGVTLDIYGTGGQDDISHLRDLARPLGDRVRFHGQLPDLDKAAAFANADLFVLPSHSENFGIVVAEALAHAVPVLTTRNTPWQALDRMGCGRCVPLSQDRLVREIRALGDEDLLAMGARGRDWVRRDFSKAVMTDSFAALYRALAPVAEGQVTA